MKKIAKFFTALTAIAAVAGGAFFVYKKFVKKEDEDFDFDDSFDDDTDPASREYVSINITTDEAENTDGSSGEEEQETSSDESDEEQKEASESDDETEQND